MAVRLKMEDGWHRHLSCPSNLIVAASAFPKVVLRSGISDGQNVSLFHLHPIGTSPLPDSLPCALPPGIPYGPQSGGRRAVKNGGLFSVLRTRILAAGENPLTLSLGCPAGALASQDR